MPCLTQYLLILCAIVLISRCHIKQGVIFRSFSIHYKKYSKISEAKFREILRYFFSDLVVIRISEITSVFTSTV